MPGTHPSYPPEFRREMVELVRSGRARGVGPRVRAVGGGIRNRVRQAGLDGGRRSNGLTSHEREELRRLKRENRQLRMEWEIPKEAAARFARKSESILERDSRS